MHKYLHEPLEILLLQVHTEAPWESSSSAEPHLLVFLIMVDLHENITKITHIFDAVKCTSLSRSWYISSQTYLFPLSPGFPKSTE